MCNRVFQMLISSPFSASPDGFVDLSVCWNNVNHSKNANSTRKCNQYFLLQNKLKDIFKSGFPIIFSKTILNSILSVSGITILQQDRYSISGMINLSNAILQSVNENFTLNTGSLQQ